MLTVLKLWIEAINEPGVSGALETINDMFIILVTKSNN